MSICVDIVYKIRGVIMVQDISTIVRDVTNQIDSPNPSVYRYDNSITGFFTTNDMFVYRHIANGIHDGVIIEIGSYLGRSILSIADICRENNNTGFYNTSGLYVKSDVRYHRASCGAPGEYEEEY